MTITATLTDKYQITIPSDIRKRLGMRKGDRLVLEVEEGKVVMRRLDKSLAAHCAGLGKEVWDSLGGADVYLDKERATWK
jgi:antitoxin PrlF